MTVHFICLLTATVVPMVSVEFQIPSVSVNESDGSVIVELVRTGNHTDNITVCINVTIIVDPAIVQRMYKLIHQVYHRIMYLNLPSIIIT